MFLETKNLQHFESHCALSLHSIKGHKPGQATDKAPYSIFLIPNLRLSWLHHRGWSTHNEMHRLRMGGRKNTKQISETPLPNKWNWTTEQQVTQPWELREKEMIHLVLGNHYTYLKPPRAMQHINIFQLISSIWKRQSESFYIHTWDDLNISLMVHSIVAMLGNIFLQSNYCHFPNHTALFTAITTIPKRTTATLLWISVLICLLLKEFNAYHLI